MRPTSVSVPAGMISKEDVAALQERLRVSDATAAQQAEELHEQGLLVQQLESRTPRPDWPAVLSGAAGAATRSESGDGVGGAGAEDVSSSALAAQLASKVGSCASSLQVRRAGVRLLAAWTTRLRAWCCCLTLDASTLA